MWNWIKAVVSFPRVAWNWVKERWSTSMLEVNWNWLSKFLSGSLSLVNFLLVGIPKYRSSKNASDKLKNFLADSLPFLVGFSFIFSFICTVVKKRATPVPDEDLKKLGELLNRLREEKEETKRRIHIEIVENQSLIQEIEELEREVKRVGKENSDLMKNIATIEQENDSRIDLLINSKKARGTNT